MDRRRVFVLVGLASLTVPRVVLHDLGVVREGTAVNAALVFVPFAVWIAVAVLRAANPFPALVAVGGISGVLLAVTHQVLWGAAFDEEPRLGGNLADLDPSVQTVVLRVFAAFSGFFTGLITGVLCGLVAWGIARAVRRSRRGEAGEGADLQGRP
ncbi:hypothetical protein [Actinomadura flavalba]|uniref:hypothetical protein n=1 Tax=Actinomadura flavalba TaxID=1120938 RepID=UPI0004754B6B|nr:hypothetical protein [Actinomadura flavalba]